MTNEEKKALKEIFASGEDIHSGTAKTIFGLTSEPTDLQRRKAKTVNFGIVYGISDWGLAEQLEIPVKEAFSLLKKGIKAFMNEWKFKQFLVMLKSAGFVNSKLINANMPLNFAYTLYLLALESDEFNAGEVNQFVQKWYVLSILTQRYSSSPESQMWTDLRNLKEKGFRNYFNEIESSVISDAFWNVKIPQDLENTSGSNPTYLTYLAAQIKNSEISLRTDSFFSRFLSRIEPSMF